MKGKIYMIPTPISEGEVYMSCPESNGNVINSLDYFVVENLRSARRFLSKAGISRQIDDLEFAELNEHTNPTELHKLIKPVLDGRNCGILSEAGVPGVADPGADLVALAHKYDIKILPLVGPSSILLALMGSGMNGQSFAFNGYLPVKPPERGKAIKNFERRAISENQSQMFIEAPYRNIKLFEDFINQCSPTTRLCVAADILGGEQYIKTLPISEWKKTKKPDINKRPAIFIIGI